MSSPVAYFFNAMKIALQSCYDSEKKKWTEELDTNQDDYIVYAEFSRYIKDNVSWNGYESSADDLISRFWRQFDTNDSRTKINNATELKNVGALDKAEQEKLGIEIYNTTEVDFPELPDDSQTPTRMTVGDCSVVEGGSTTLAVTLKDNYGKAIEYDPQWNLLFLACEYQNNLKVVYQGGNFKLICTGDPVTKDMSGIVGRLKITFPNGNYIEGDFKITIINKQQNDVTDKPDNTGLKDDLKIDTDFLTGIPGFVDAFKAAIGTYAEAFMRAKSNNATPGYAYQEFHDDQFTGPILSFLKSNLYDKLLDHYEKALSNNGMKCAETEQNRFDDIFDQVANIVINDIKYIINKLNSGYTFDVDYYVNYLINMFVKKYNDEITEQKYVSQ